jgi:hypothetical protein
MNVRRNNRATGTTVGRRLTGLAAVAVLALLGAACGGDDGEDAEETTTTAPTETTLATLSDEEFDEEVDEMLLDPVEAAGTDICAVFDAASGPGPSAMPSTENQVRKIVDSFVVVLEALAGTEPVDEEQAAVLLETAQDLRATAEEQGYSMELLEDPEFAQLQSSPEFLEAAQAYTDRYEQECQPAAEGDGAAGDGAADDGAVDDGAADEGEADAET